jgi:chromate reductase, NAD(P)H dehydrogenase (quinone)
MRILGISGSLSQTSANSRLLHSAAEATNAVDVRVWEGLGQLPFFSPDAEANEHVSELRQGLADADAVWIATPEYAGGMPGALKNALDWLVGSGELDDAPGCALIGALQDACLAGAAYRLTG